MIKKTYKNIYFDLDNTLWDFKRNSEITLRELINKHVPELSERFDEFLSTYHQINDKLWLDYRNGKLTKAVLRTKRFNDTFKHFDIDNNGFAKDFGEAYISKSPYKTVLLPNTHETLSYLKHKGYNLYLLTNGFVEVQVIKIKENKLEQYFKKMITSEDAGYKKPDKRIFEHALKTVNAKKSESIMIGDDLESDIIGANSFGMDTVFFNPEKKQTAINPTFEINDLKELQLIL